VVANNNKTEQSANSTTTFIQNILIFLENYTVLNLKMIYINTGNMVLPPYKWLGWHLKNHNNVQVAKPSSISAG
jgi:predicted HAD superfamily hydrolase